MAYDETDLQRMMDNILKPQDTFQFECDMCGNCCRKRQTPILLTGYDIFRISQALDLHPFITVQEKTHCSLGSDSHIPIFVLKERLDGSCSLLRKGKCMVHQNKPIVCAVFPLGRFFDGENYTYFNQGVSCGIKGNTKTWTLQEWLDSFHVEEADAPSKGWHKMMMGLALTMTQIPEEKIDIEMASVMASYLYLRYDIHKPYEEQLEQNKIMLQQRMKERFNIAIAYEY